ncbi:MAG TPA: YdcF family protein [Ramlibacter sp.]|uniref:YdcF family protein n=1 Tax=Ramlibacter sp. TaxID=1917967 RepID=UPI002ED21E30
MRKGWRRALWSSGGLLALAALATFLAATPAGAATLLYLLEWQARPADPDRIRHEAQAIVVIGGRTLRIEHGAKLHLATGVPLLLVGKGTGDSGFEAESEKMEDILLRKWGIGPRWVETESLDTSENAKFAWCLVSSMDVRRIALVTDPAHMPRARRRFEAAGFDVIPAPTSVTFFRPPPLTLASFTPGRKGFAAAKQPLREWAGALFGGIEAWVRPPRPCPGEH